MDDYQSFTYVDDTEIQNSSNINYEPITIHLLPGEEITSFSPLNYGCRLGLTQFRIIIIYDILKDEHLSTDIISIPLGLIYHIEQYGFICLNIITKIGRKFSVTFPNIELCEEIINKIKQARALKPFAIEFYKNLMPNHFLLETDERKTNQAFEHHLVSMEFQRLKFSPAEWTISDVNAELKLCSTYPQYHIIPRKISVDAINNMAKFRSKNRFITVCYRCAETGTFMLRSGQPLIGMSWWRNNEDEEYFRLINELHGSGVHDNSDRGPRLKIFDARSYTSAQLNRVKGGGMECEDNYQNSVIEFLGIPNMHTVRSSFDSLAKALVEHDGDNFYDLVVRSNWLQLIRQLLKSATSISDAMYRKRKSVLIHCSDGWDRTPQLTSLSQLIIDPFYRTIEGFKILIYREWILFGHRFNERCALWPFDFSRDYSPIFLQWLDCVYQLFQQFPDYFHFNETFLIKLAIHVYSGLFGTFNSKLSETFDTCSLWSYLGNKDIQSFINPLYSPKLTFTILKPKLQPLNIKLWSKLYFDALNPNYYEAHNLEKYNCEIPQEINNISMQNSLINSEEDLDDDYEGEDAPSNRSVLLKELNGDYCASIYPMKIPKRKSNTTNYFDTVCLKSSLESLERKASNYFLDLDLDGLHRQKDFIDTFSDLNRRWRLLYKSKIESYRKEITRLSKLTFENLVSSKDNCVEESGKEIEYISEASVDSLSVDSELSIFGQVVRWVPDHAVTNCAGCDSMFYLLNRKHHCRSCGKIFCHSCSKNKSAVPSQKLDWCVRVCNECYKVLNPCDLKVSSGSYIPFLNMFWKS